MSKASRARQAWPAQGSVIESIVLQHAEEAAFLWLLRDAAVCAPHYSLPDLAKLDGRIEAHLDGLMVAGASGWDTCREELQWEEPGEVFTAAALAFLSDDVARMRPVLEAARAQPELTRACIAALGFLPQEKTGARVTQMLASSDPSLQLIGLSACAIHRHDPGRSLERFITHTDMRLRARAIRAIGELGRRDLVRSIRGMTNDPDPSVKFWALWSMALIGDKTVAGALLEYVRPDFARHADALDLAFRLMSPEDARFAQLRLADDASTRRLEIAAAGVIGDPSLIPWLIEVMADEEQARISGESFTMITGIELDRFGFDRQPPEGHEPGPTDDSTEPDVSMDEDENLSWPDPFKITDWWNKNGSRFAKGTRHLMGQPITTQSLSEVLVNGRQRQRANAALELMLLSTGTEPLFEVRAHGKRQQRLLGMLPSRSSTSAR